MREKHTSPPPYTSAAERIAPRGSHRRPRTHAVLGHNRLSKSCPRKKHFVSVLVSPRLVSFLFCFFRFDFFVCRSPPPGGLSQVLGDYVGSLPEMRRILSGRRQGAFAEGAYDVVRKNCNNFCDEFAFALVGKRIPAWVNRAATLGTWAGLGEVGSRYEQL